MFPQTTVNVGSLRGGGAMTLAHPPQQGRLMAHPRLSSCLSARQVTIAHSYNDGSERGRDWRIVRREQWRSSGGRPGDLEQQTHAQKFANVVERHPGWHSLGSFDSELSVPQYARRARPTSSYVQQNPQPKALRTSVPEDQAQASPLHALGGAWAAMPARQKLTLAASLAFVSSNMDKVILTVAILPMAEDFGWTPSQAGLVQSAFFWGFALMQIPGGYLASTLGGRRLLPAGLALWSLATAAVPLAASTIGGLCATRAVMGLGQGIAPSAIIDMIARTVPKEERSTSTAAAFGGLHVGSIVGLIAAPTVINTVGWGPLFATFGAAGIVWYAWYELLLLPQLAKQDPEMVRQLQHGSSAGVASISGSSSSAPASTMPPYRAFLRSQAVQALMFTHFCNSWFHYTMLAWLPTYFVDTLSVDLMHAAQTALLPPLAGIAASAIAGPAADALISRGVKLSTVRKLAQCTAFLVPAGCLVAASTIPHPIGGDGSMGPESVATVALITAALGISNFSLAGLYCTHQDMSPKHASVLISLTNTAGAMPGIVGVAAVGWLYDVTNGSWELALFLPSAMFMALGAAVYTAFARNSVIDFDSADNSPFGWELRLRHKVMPLVKRATAMADKVLKRGKESAATSRDSMDGGSGSSMVKDEAVANRRAQELREREQQIAESATRRWTEHQAARMGRTLSSARQAFACKVLGQCDL